MSFAPVTLAGRSPGASLVLTCEHASPAVPPEFRALGLAAEQLRDHIGWDIGAASITEELSRQLGVPAVLSAASRLLVDCNRDLSDADLMPQESHGIAIPGNARIDSAERAERLRRFYEPYHRAVDAVLAAHAGARLLSIHSFTPALNGQERPFDVGVLFDAHGALADVLARRIAATGLAVRMNEPYSALDGLIFSARSHGLCHHVPYLELEVNNRLLRRDDEARAVARRLADAVASLLDPPTGDR
ncbi:MAG: N-formylglutamate amidohydrolase [Candidatus Binatia bacterium]